MAGLSLEESAEVLQVSTKTVARDWDSRKPGCYARSAAKQMSKDG